MSPHILHMSWVTVQHVWYIVHHGPKTPSFFNIQESNIDCTVVPLEM